MTNTYLEEQLLRLMQALPQHLSRDIDDARDIAKRLRRELERERILQGTQQTSAT